MQYLARVIFRFSALAPHFQKCYAPSPLICNEKCRDSALADVYSTCLKRLADPFAEKGVVEERLPSINGCGAAAIPTILP